MSRDMNPVVILGVDSHIRRYPYQIGAVISDGRVSQKYLNKDKIIKIVYYI